MNDTHIDPHLLARLAEGRLARGETAPLLGHLETCARCRDALAAASDAVAEAPEAARGTTFSLRPWLIGIAAVLAVVLLAVPLLRQRRHDGGIDQLVELAPRSGRMVAARLSGGFAWAAWRGPMRAESPAVETERLHLAGAAADAIDRATRERTAEAEHAAAIALLLIERPLEAEARLAAAVRTVPDDASLWSDLAAARTAAADQLGKPSLYPRALAAADRALAIDARRPEALFNRALTIERMGLSDEAQAAWYAYLTVDDASEWAREAREHLARLSSAPPRSSFERERPRLERAAAAGDVAAVASIAAADPLRARTFGETWYLGQWGMAVQRGDEAAARTQLATARALGDALAVRSGEHLLRDSVHAIDTAADRRALASAHALYFRGRLTYSRQKPVEAEPELRQAAAQFGSAPMALAARYYLANTRFDQGALSPAREELSRLLEQVDGRYGALAAQVRWQLALCEMVDGNWDAALPHLRAAEKELTRLGERSHAAFLETLLADALASVGEFDEAWSTRIRALSALSADALGDRLAVSLAEAARMELRLGNRDAALPLLRLEEEATRRTGKEPLVVDALVRVAVLHSALGDAAASAAAVREASAAADRIEDAALRARARIDVQFATAYQVSAADPRRARTLLDGAIAAYRERELPVYLPEAYLLRARAAIALGDREAAARDLDEGVAVLERYRVRLAGNVDGTGVLDAGESLFEEAIALALDRGEPASALAYAERSRARFHRGEPFDAARLQQRLAGSGAAVLELVALPRELVAFSMTEGGLHVARKAVAREALKAAVARGDEGELYDLLIRPSADSVTRSGQLLVVPDPAVAAVPFAALRERETNHHLVERLAVALAPSAAALQRIDAAAPRSILAMALPSGDGQSKALPEGEREVADVATFYSKVTTLKAARFRAFAGYVPDADVVHLAGHTARQPGAGDAALVFAPDERVAWQELASCRFPPRAVVVLAACETLRPPPGRAHALSLGDGALAGGASEVIGTLEPIPDADAREIFRAVHRHLASGAGAAEALRLAQLEQRVRGGSWRAVSVLTTRLP